MAKATYWLVTDNDALQALDWIRAGGLTGADEEDLSNAYLDYFHTGVLGPQGVYIETPLDAKSEFENCVGGWWAPYRLTSVSYNYESGQKTPYVHPAFTDAYYFNPDPNSYDTENVDQWNPGKLVSMISNDMNNLASVDIVFTNDQSKWTRCPIIEMGNDPSLTQGNATLLKGNGNVFSAEDIAAINSSKGLTYEFDTLDGETSRMAVYG